MASIIFKGVSAEEMGMFVQEMPDPVRAKRRIEAFEVAGRSGKLHIDEGVYDPISLTAKINANGAHIDDINAWLDGYGDLVLTDEPDKRYRANAFASTKGARKRLPSGRIYDVITVTFECDPHRYERVPEVRELNGKFTFRNIGTDFAEPTILIRGSGAVSLTVGDITVSLDNLSGEVMIDSEAGCAYKGVSDTPTVITLDDGDWPVFPLGDTRVSWVGNVQRVVVTPNWRWK